MNTSKMVARLRALREAVGRTGDGSEDRAEAGFTLIELMVVLLIMAILLAIAIPTFLGVTAGAKKTATQSDLTTASTSATAVYSTKTQSFASTVKTTLQKTQTTIKFVPGTVAPAAGKNVVSVDRVTGNMLILSADDGVGCWAVVMNNSNGILKTSTTTGAGSTLPGGNHYFGFKNSTTKLKTCKANTIGALTTLTATNHTNFKTVTGIT